MWLIGNLSESIDIIVGKNPFILTSAILDCLLDSSLSDDPETDLPFMRLLMATPSYEPQGQLFKAYRTFRNDQMKVYLVRLCSFCRVTTVCALEYVSSGQGAASQENLQMLILKDFISSSGKLRTLLPYLLRWLIRGQSMGTLSDDDMVLICSLRRQ